MNGGWLDDWLASIDRGEWDAQPVTAGKPVRPADGYSFTAQVRGTAPEPPPDGFLVPPAMSEALMQNLRENFAAMDAWYDSQRGPVTPPSLRTRLRRKREAWRERAAKRAYTIIAGYEPPTPEDW